MASPLESLPPEMVQKCVEFLPFDKLIERGAWAWEAHRRSDAALLRRDRSLKSVSKTVCAAVRRALTKGRWRPIRCVAEQGLAVCAAGDHAWPDDPLHGNGAPTDPPPAAAPLCAIFREAWALDPALVIRIIIFDWNTYPARGPPPANLIPSKAKHGVYQGRFLWIVEPSAAGLSRVVSALEATYVIQGELGAPVYFPHFMLFMMWMAHPQIFGTPGDAGKLVGIGLEAWADSHLAADFAANYMFDNLHYTGDDLDMLDVTAPLWSEGWENRANAMVFCAEIARIREVRAEGWAALLNGEYDSESESDDSDSEPQYDDDDPRAY